LTRIPAKHDLARNMSAAGRYTDQAMRDVWKGRKQQQLPWGEVGSYADTSEAAIRSVVLAAR
jgi:hypothetical protein